MDENKRLKQSRILLDIVVEQLQNKENPKTLERIEVLIDEYVSSYNCHFEELETTLRRLKVVLLKNNSTSVPILK